ncbi:MAG TPA: c-type cytochrome [Gemmatimonadales bacterium]|nr:c-type cytochrome [Gemmatimonadales bacterium]
MRRAAIPAFLALALLFVPVAQAQQPQAASEDSLRADRARHVSAIRQSIQGRENLPGDSVFKNLKILGGVPADRILRMMEMGYSPALGVSCDYCHEVDDWSSDRKQEKNVARGMVEMVRTINTQLLRGIPGIKSGNPAVNCGMCHQGNPRPGARQGQ